MKYIKAVILTIAIIGVVLVMGAVGDVDNGATFEECAYRLSAGCVMLLVAFFAEAVRESLKS